MHTQGSNPQTSVERVEVVVFFFRRLTNPEHFYKVTAQVQCAEGNSVGLVLEHS